MDISIESLPKIIRDGIREKGIVSFTPPQIEALRSGVLDGINVVVSAPTASGKTLIGELALINAVLRGKKGIYTSPLKALAYEKYQEFRFWEKYGFRIGISMGDYEVTEEELKRLENYDIIVTTYERLDSIMRRRPLLMNNIGTIVIDELHMLGDRDRGHIVEMIAIRAKLMGIQIVGLSATIGNAEEVARWLNAKLVKSDWRPVKLYEVIAYYSGRSEDRQWYMYLPKEISDGPSPIVVDDITKYWILRAVKEGFNVLEFRYSRKAVEELASIYSIVLCANLDHRDRVLLDKLAEELKEYVPDFEYEKLAPLIRCGASYHHAGLTPEARRFIENAFRERFIRYLAATPTLAMGVNLPARVVIINTKYFNGRSLEKISVLEYKQLSGRAGRPQYDPYGIVVVAKDSRSMNESLSYIRGVPEPITSTLLSDEALRKHVLAVIVSGEVNTFDKLITFFSNSFGASRLSGDVLRYKLASAVELLEELNMIKRRESDTKTLLTPTKLGITTSWLYIDPLTSFIVIEGLRDRTNVSDLYYLTLIGMTPDFSDISLPKGIYEWFSDLAEEYEIMGEIPPERIEYSFRDPEINWMRGFIIGLILRDWIDEVPERNIIEKYGIEAGDLRVIRENGEWLTYAASAICRVLNMDSHANRLSVIVERIKHGVKEDAIPLARLRYIGRVRARLLLNNNIKSVEDILRYREKVIKILGEGWGSKIILEAQRFIEQKQ